MSTSPHWRLEEHSIRLVRKNVRTKGRKGDREWNAVLRKWCDAYAHEFTQAVVVCTRSAQNQASQNYSTGGKDTEEAPSLGKEQLAADRHLAQKCQFSWTKC